MKTVSKYNKIDLFVIYIIEKKFAFTLSFEMDSPIQNKRIKLELNINDDLNNIRIYSLYVTPIEPRVSYHFS